MHFRRPLHHGRPDWALQECPLHRHHRQHWGSPCTATTSGVCRGPVTGAANPTSQGRRAWIGVLEGRATGACCVGHARGQFCRGTCSSGPPGHTRSTIRRAARSLLLRRRTHCLRGPRSPCRCHHMQDAAVRGRGSRGSSGPPASSNSKHSSGHTSLLGNLKREEQLTKCTRSARGKVSTFPHLKQVVLGFPDGLLPGDGPPALLPLPSLAPPGLARGGSSSHWKKGHCPSPWGLGQRKNILQTGDQHLNETPDIRSCRHAMHALNDRISTWHGTMLRACRRCARSWPRTWSTADRSCTSPAGPQLQAAHRPGTAPAALPALQREASAAAWARGCLPCRRGS